MSTLHLSKHDIASMAVNADGSVTINLTSEGESSLLDCAALRVSARQREGERRRVKLRALSTPELVDLATKRFGGPDELMMEEMKRRMDLALATIRPAFEALRSAGVLPSS